MIVSKHFLQKSVSSIKRCSKDLESESIWRSQPVTSVWSSLKQAHLGCDTFVWCQDRYTESTSPDRSKSSILNSSMWTPILICHDADVRSDSRRMVQGCIEPDIYTALDNPEEFGKLLCDGCRETLDARWSKWKYGTRRIYLNLVTLVMPSATLSKVVSEELNPIKELESLGLDASRLNEFNDDKELIGLADAIKAKFVKEYSRSLPF